MTGRIRRIVEDTENIARGLQLAYHRHGMTAHTYAASLAACYMGALRQIGREIGVDVEEVAP